MIMQFEHIVTRIPLNVRMTVRQSVMYKIGFKYKIIDEIMRDNNISEYEFFSNGVKKV